MPLWLPVYTPNLNLMKQVSRFLKQHLACYRLWDDVDGLRAVAATLLSQTEAHFHADDAPDIRLVINFCQSAQA